jgi:hypothetical protein
VAGILNRKNRILDVVITEEGRRKMSSGHFSPSYASFTDAGSDYGRAEESLFSFEASSNMNDVITLDCDENGNLMTESEGIVLSSSVGEISKQINDRFKKNQILFYEDDFYESDTFTPGSSDITFSISDNKFFQDIESADNIPSIFEDPKFSQYDNFLYLPPLNKSTSDADATPIGNYPRIGNQVDWQKYFDNEVENAKNFGGVKDIKFGEGPEKRNVLIQIFSETTTEIKKLTCYKLKDVIFESENSEVYICGKEVTDSKMSTTFIPVFYIVTS